MSEHEATIADLQTELQRVTESRDRWRKAAIKLAEALSTSTISSFEQNDWRKWKHAFAYYREAQRGR